MRLGRQRVLAHAHLIQGLAQPFRRRRLDQRRPLALQGLDEFEEAVILVQAAGLDQPQALVPGLHPDHRRAVLQRQAHRVGGAAGAAAVLSAPHRHQQVGGAEDPARLRQVRVAALGYDGGAVQPGGELGQTLALGPGAVVEKGVDRMDGPQAHLAPGQGGDHVGPLRQSGQ